VVNILNIVCCQLGKFRFWYKLRIIIRMLPLVALQINVIVTTVWGGGGGTLLVAQLVEALRYKPEGRGFDTRWCHWNFSLTLPHYGSGVDSASNRNEYRKYLLGVKAAGA
jgi:hypothetical protein